MWAAHSEKQSSNRLTACPEFKGRLAMGPICGLKAIQAIDADPLIHPIKTIQGKLQMVDSAAVLFTSSKQIKKKNEVQNHEAELFQQIGCLKMELECLKGTSKNQVFAVALRT